MVVDVPLEIKEQLNDIQQRVTSQELTLASIQGMIITQATLQHQSQQTFAQPSTMQGYQPAAAKIISNIVIHHVKIYLMN